MENTINYWGIQITLIEEMKFDRWKSDRNNCPAFNTISHEKRVEYLQQFLNTIRK